ncbi:MAG: caspase family protein [Nitrospirae bacterium]|nr:caspase family protein [Nitrospirota bacterium]
MRQRTIDPNNKDVGATRWVAQENENNDNKRAIHRIAPTSILYNTTWFLIYLLVGCAGYTLIISKPELAGTINQAPSGPIIPQGSTRETFTQDDPFAYVLIELKDLTGEHELRWRWVDPNGNVYVETLPSLLGKKGFRYPNIKVSHKIKIEGERAAGLPGRWRVQLVLDGRPVAERGFQILEILARPDTTPPFIEILSPQVSLGTRDLKVVPTIVLKEETTIIRGIVRDDSAISWVKINGEQADLDVRGNFFLNVPLKKGDNVFEVQAMDAARNVAHLNLVIRRSLLPASVSPIKYRRSWAVVIGIDRYQKVPELRFASTDAKAIGGLLEKQGFTVRTLLDEQATARRIRSLLATDLPKEMGPEDRALIFFAGHGQDRDLPMGGKMGYLIPWDGDLNDLHGTALSMGDIKELARILPAKHVLFLVDACYGGVAGTQVRGLKDSTEEYITRVMKEPGRQLITAGGADQQVVEGPRWGHSVFTYYLLQGLDKRLADLNGDGIILASELYAYLDPRVSQESEQQQRPEFWSLSGERGEFVFMPTLEGEREKEEGRKK